MPTGPAGSGSRTADHWRGLVLPTGGRQTRVPAKKAEQHPSFSEDQDLFMRSLLIYKHLLP